VVLLSTVPPPARLLAASKAFAASKVDAMTELQDCPLSKLAGTFGAVARRARGITPNPSSRRHLLRSKWFSFTPGGFRGGLVDDATPSSGDEGAN
jgi:hypothetical protein